MSTGLTIHTATYGAGSSTVDVTGAVSSKVKDGVLNFTVSPTSLNVEDPAPGQLKTLSISYTVNDGRKNSISKKDNDLVFIDAPPERVASGLQITKAQYGYEGNWTDVTDAVQNYVSNGSINVKAGFKEVGIPDPNPNKQKQLQVEYTINGSPTVSTFNDGERFQVSAPPRQGKSNTSPSDGIWSIIGSLWSGVFKFGLAFFYVVSIYASKSFGEQVYPSIGMVFWMLGFLLPGFAYWGLPPLVFIIRIFRSTDLVTESGFQGIPITDMTPV